MSKRERVPVLPGEVLFSEFMEPFGLSQNALGRAIKVPPIRIHEIVRGKRALTPDTALRLSKFFCTTAEFWLGLQTGYDLGVAKNGLGVVLDDIKPLPGAVERLKKGVPSAHANDGTDVASHRRLKSKQAA
ncbi:MAG: HigA family addiction module antidote protein [Nitrospinae bacterium]|nr:HigA family addiction module antidote protein [Nitrospinota bacterium]